jgi:zinc protease
METDRLGFLPSAMDQEKLDNQRDVVKNERRQGVDNQPYGHANELILSMMYPDRHPYSWSVIGSMQDLTMASMEDVMAFFNRYYTPNNASLTIAGDFDPQVAKALVDRYFANLPPGPPVERLTDWVPQLDGVKRTVAEDDVELPRLDYVWHTPAFYAPGDAEFDLLANILSTGKTSRLYKALVYEQQIAQSVVAYQASRELSSTFHIQVTAQQGHSLDDIERAVDTELRKILTDGITADELEQARTTWEAFFVRGLEAIGGFGGRADLLNQYNTYLGDPDMLTTDMERYKNATIESVMEFVREYIDFDNRAILHIVPQGALLASDDVVDRTSKPAPMAEPEFTPPEIQRTTLSNGLEILLVEDHKLPLVDMNLVLKSGWAADPPGKFGTAALTAAMLNEGTLERTALEISEEAKRLAAQLGTGSSFDGSTVSLNTLKKNLDPALDLMADIVQPGFS